MYGSHSRPVGSKFEMSGRIYYSAKRAHNVLGHSHLPSPPHAARYPSSRMLLLSNCFLGRFEAVLKPLSLSLNHSVAAVALENEALLYAFFVFAAVMARVFARDLL